MDEALVPAGDDHASLACHGGVDGVAAEIITKDAILGRGWHAADDVAGVDVFEIELGFFRFEVLA